MGFPSGYCGVLVPRLLVHFAFLLHHTKNAICWILRWIGLAEDLEPETSSWQDTGENTPAGSRHSAEMIRGSLPVVEFGAFAERFGEAEDDVMCAVCLSSFEKDEEIRQLCNCCHIFHRGCLDKWLDHDQKTCPLCRSSLVPQRIDTQDVQESWVVDRIAYLFGEDLVVAPS